MIETLEGEERDNYRKRVTALRQRNLRQGRHPREVLRMVPNAPLREALQDAIRWQRTNLSTVASSVGMFMNSHSRGRMRKTPDTVRLQRVLGMLESTRSKDRYRDPVTGKLSTYYLDAIEYETAVKIAHAIPGVIPAEVGI